MTEYRVVRQNAAQFAVERAQIVYALARIDRLARRVPVCLAHAALICVEAAPARHCTHEAVFDCGKA